MRTLLLVLALVSTLDLPIAPVKFGDPEPKREVVPEKPVLPPVEDDPRETPPPTFYGEDINVESDSVVYVFDLSGSMNQISGAYEAPDGSQQSGRRYASARSELVKSLRGLGSNFRFNIVVFDCKVASWAPQLMQASNKNKKSAEIWIRKTASRDDGFLGLGQHKKGSWGGDPYVGGVWGGQTATGPAVVFGLKWRQNKKIILLTDGAPNCPWGQPDQHLSAILKGNVQGATIDVFGISAKGVYRAFCQRVAALSGGSYHDVR